MSAFVVEDKTINRIITFLATDRDSDWIRKFILKELGINIGNPDGQETLGNLMFSLNCDAVNQRYGDDEAGKFRDLDYSYRLEIFAGSIMAFKSLKCWQYQCSEGNIPETHLYEVMERVAGYLAESIVQRLPEYDRSGGW
jgi:hypothetical protein